MPKDLLEICRTTLVVDLIQYFTQFVGFGPFKISMNAFFVRFSNSSLANPQFEFFQDLDSIAHAHDIYGESARYELRRNLFHIDSSYKGR